MTKDTADNLIAELRDLQQMFEGIMETINQREKLVERLENLKLTALRERKERWLPIQPHPIPSPRALQ